mgnify:CR=1 FL=1
MEKKKGRKGFTLIELIVAVGIMLILAAVATPFLLSHIKNAKVGNINEQILNIKGAFDSYYTDKGGLALDGNNDGDILDDMVSSGWISEVQERNGMKWSVVAVTDTNGKTAHVVKVEFTDVNFYNDVITKLDESADGATGPTDGILRYCSGTSFSVGGMLYLLRADAGFDKTALDDLLSNQICAQA